MEESSKRYEGDTKITYLVTESGIRFNTQNNDSNLRKLNLTGIIVKFSY